MKAIVKYGQKSIFGIFFFGEIPGPKTSVFGLFLPFLGNMASKLRCDVGMCTFWGSWNQIWTYCMDAAPWGLRKNLISAGNHEKIAVLALFWRFSGNFDTREVTGYVARCKMHILRLRKPNLDIFNGRRTLGFKKKSNFSWKSRKNRRFGPVSAVFG